MTETWRATDARRRFSALLSAAADSMPQHIGHRDGREFVLVSRDGFDMFEQGMRAVLLSGPSRSDPDEFDAALARARDLANRTFAPTLHIAGKLADDGDPP